MLTAVLLVMHGPAGPVAAARPQSPESSTAVPTRLEGFLKAILSDRWLVGEYSVVVDAQTVLVEKRGRVEVGAWVIVWGTLNEDGRTHAEVLQVDRPAGHAGPTLQFSGLLRKKTAEYWVIEQTPVKITGTTQILGNPATGALVWVEAEQVGDTLTAVTIELIGDDPQSLPAEFEGRIQAFGPEHWVVGGHQVVVGPDTEVIGEPSLDQNAEVKATIEADGTLAAQLIRVVDPFAEARLSAVVAAIAADPDGTQTWEVLVFPKEPWTDPEIGVLHVDTNTLVDESRAVAQAGQWADVRGVKLGQGEYQAEVIQLEHPIPVTLDGEFAAAPTATGGGGWWQINGQPVWLANSQAASVGATYAEGNATVVGVRLPNGVIWAKQVHRTEGTMR